MTLVEYVFWAVLPLTACFIFLLIAFDQGEQSGVRATNAKRDAVEVENARIAQRIEELEREALLQMRQRDAENRQTDAIEALIAHAVNQALKLQETTKAFERYENASLELRSKHYQENASEHAAFLKAIDMQQKELDKLALAFRRQVGPV